MLTKITKLNNIQRTIEEDVDNFQIHTNPWNPKFVVKIKTKILNHIHTTKPKSHITGCNW